MIGFLNWKRLAILVKCTRVYMKKSTLGGIYSKGRVLIIITMKRVVNHIILKKILNIDVSDA